jgi:hypothetical protein
MKACTLLRPKRLFRETYQDNNERSDTTSKWCTNTADRTTPIKSAPNVLPMSSVEEEDIVDDSPIRQQCGNFTVLYIPHHEAIGLVLYKCTAHHNKSAGSIGSRRVTSPYIDASNTETSAIYHYQAGAC